MHGRRAVAAQVLNYLAIATLCAFLSACHTIPESHLVASVPPRSTSPEGAAIVAVRWPMVIDEAALELIERELKDSVPSIKIPEGHRRISQQSTYYALELYAYLRTYLGSDEVLLEPYAVTRDGTETLKYKPIFGSTIPVAFAVDVVEPAAWVLCCMGGFGDLVWTNFRVSVAPSASPQTCGLLGGSYYRSTGFSTRVMPVKPMVDAKCNAETVRGGPHYTLLDVYTSTPPRFRDDFKEADALPLRANAVVVWPAPRVWLTKDYVQRVRQPFSVNAENPANTWVATMARAIAQAASTMNLQELTRGSWAEYAPYYDPGLSRDSSDPATAARLRAIRILSKAEKQWVVKQNEKIAEALLNGSFGKSFRQQRAMEAAARQHESGRSMSAAMNMWSMGMNTGLFGGKVPFDSMAMAQGMAQHISAELQAQSAIVDYMRNELGPEAAALDQMIQVDIAGVARQINADSRPKLREQLKQLYLERFRSDAR